MLVRKLEDILIDHPDVAEVCVISVPNDENGTKPKAFVVLRDNAHCSVEQLHAFCDDRLPEYAGLKDVHILPELPKGPLGIVSRRKLVDFALQTN
ncbi:MAG TPA: hypothetical protein PLI09_17575 [Candidatus Hydrogenedentes bacterium]|nr:hypothetical protein [Candidatus Hydrogenedentota bacterium]